MVTPASAWFCALAVLGLYFTYVLIIAFAPDLLMLRVTPGSHITIGLAGGAAIVAGSVCLTFVYAAARNRRG